MLEYRHVDVSFRGKRQGIEVVCFRGEVEDWSFEDMSAKSFQALCVTPMEIEEIEEQVLDAI